MTGREQFVVIRICDGEGWELLYPFLNVPIPDQPFLRSNAS